MPRPRAGRMRRRAAARAIEATAPSRRMMTGLRCAWVTFLSVTHMGMGVAIWKLNDHIISSGDVNRCHMLDLDLLRSFLSVVDTGGFTRAGERVHRTQETVSHQSRRLEESLGYPLLHRHGKQAAPTEQGERLVSYARRLLALEQEARDVLARPGSDGVVRIGIPEDFAAYR